MQLLYWFEGIRAPWLNRIMLLLTELGGETVFLMLALVMFWCADKRRAYYLIAVGFVGTVANQFLKIACQVPRPWIKDPDFTIVEAARAGADGYSFPSGHSQNAVGTFGSIAITAKTRWLRVLSTAAAVLVPVTRMYLGVHTPLDVLVGSGMALALLVVFRPILSDKDGRYLPRLFIGMTILSAVYLIYTELFPFPAEIDLANLYSARKNAYTLLGAIGGMTAVLFYDRRGAGFSTEASAWGQFLKVLGGLALVLLVKEGLKVPLNALFHDHLFARSVRYFLVVLAAGVLWPKTFPFFSRLGRKESK